MILGKMASLMLLGTLFSFLPIHESVLEKLDGYKFPVYSAQFCPRNATEWKTRSTMLNCTEKNAYTCLPNEHFTQLLQFCYTDPHIIVEEGLCLYLIKRNSLVHGYKCKHFQFGCPSSSYLSTKIYDYQSCIHVENGCFFADPKCEREIITEDRKSTKQIDINKIYRNKTDDSTATYLQETTGYVERKIDTIDNEKGWTFFVTLLAVCFLIFFSTLFIIRKRKNQKSRKEVEKKKDDIEKCENEEKVQLNRVEQADKMHPEKGVPNHLKAVDKIAEDRFCFLKEKEDVINNVTPKIHPMKTERKFPNILTETSANEQMPSIKIQEEITKDPSSGQNIKSKNKRRATAAIDFGTSYSVYAYSWVSNWRQIQSKEWNSEYFYSSKASTSLILNPNQTFLASGYEAELKYFKSNEDEDDEEKTPKKNINDYYFFPGFKDLLYNENLDLDSDIEDYTGKKIKALSIFSMIIENFQKSLLEAMKLSSFEGTISISDVYFVLAVPASCGEGAKVLMRKAAEKAGIETDQLTIVYEEEAISSYCQHMHLDNLLPDDEKENEYMVVDLGGGSVDIVVYKQFKDGTLKKLYPHKPCTRERFGGMSFDDEYKQFLENIWGKDIIEIFAEDHKEDYLILQKEFERKLRDPSNTNVMHKLSNTKKTHTIPIPLRFHELLEKKYTGHMKKALDSSIYKYITYGNNRLKLPHDVIMKFFQNTIQYVLNIIEKNRQNTDVKIIIIGGLAENDIFTESLLERLPTDWRIVIPHMARLAVLKGAVYYGHNQNIYSIKEIPDYRRTLRYPWYLRLLCWSNRSETVT